MTFEKLDDRDKKLIEAATDVLKRNYDPIKHTIGAAVMGGSGKIYTGINVKACAYRPCAEVIAIGSAFSQGEKRLVGIAAVGKPSETDPPLVYSPCGNCRQLILDYAPDCRVIFSDNGQVFKANVRELLPGAYESSFARSQTP